MKSLERLAHQDYRYHEKSSQFSGYAKKGGNWNICHDNREFGRKEKQGDYPE